MPVARGTEIGAALFFLLPFYGVCTVAIVRASLRRRHYAGGQLRQVSLRGGRTAVGPDHRPVAG
jgi:hypothetical protein